MTPDAVVERVEDVEPALLARWGTRGIVLDLDNTIVPWNTADVAPAVRAWVGAILAAAIGVCVLTNNYTRRASGVAEMLGVPIIKGALKPSPIAFREALRRLSVPASRAAVVGDQLFTDVLGGKLLGMRAVLVKPLSDREFPTTRIVRWFERPFRDRLRRDA
ncbi:MAG TPA: YqeG family HAD IIIA-type phosphatase [Candidatus Eremiobacteraceae bacterium]|nr:YqeG family HAD IIIA-type phosphatase [Candidatus Eremiobacteraceae bacterium]